MHRPLVVPGIVLAALAAFAPAPAAAQETGAAEITAEEIRAHVGFLASDDLEGRKPGSDGWRKAAAYIEESYRALDLEPAGDDGSFFQEVGIFGQRGRNILGLLPGHHPERKAEVVILSCHYDHLGVRDGKIMNGADDDASGVAVMMEVAEALARAESPLERSVLFACFDLEESGLLGALHYVNHPAAPLEKTIVDINLEVLGNDLMKGIPDSLFAFGTEYDAGGTIRKRVDPLAEAHGLDLRYLSSTLVKFRGDHEAFLMKKVPFLFLAAGTTHTYHRPEDDPDTLNYPKLEKEGRFVRDLVASLAGGEETPTFRKPEGAIRLEDAIVLGDLIDVMLDEREELRLSKEEVLFLELSGRRLDEMTREEKPTILDQGVVAVAFLRALRILTRPRPSIPREF